MAWLSYLLNSSAEEEETADPPRRRGTVLGNLIFYLLGSADHVGGGLETPPWHISFIADVEVVAGVPHRL